MPRLGLQETSREIVPASSSSRSFDNMAGLSAPVAAFEGGQVVVRRQEHVRALNRWEHGAHGELVTSDGAFTPVSHRAAAAEGADPCWLQLGLTEAYHLAFVQNRLRILLAASAGDGATAGDCWVAFCQSSARFPHEYAAYQRLISDGWRVRSGLSFGADFALYSAVGGREHASHLALVQAAAIEAPLTWRALQSHVRLSHQVNKRLVLCHVGADDTQSAALNGSGGAELATALSVALLTVNGWSPARAHGEESALE